ncbi:3-hydroxyacyl-CoA dehydrogenase NAD-binding domain-containing protein [Actinomadura rubrisoli]|uniref:Hydroxylacyl-CoA dehydrogenase n=1 Tax=Actinomadura rubrisoli TaxID=2530368 RepID=A0A4R5APB9_9ACTN|nr:3-hydroxyacyl-CoA dehydrogenase NAD-binding domain-containing protein [Actinomadura rubrisoli]TDD73466.1 hydroxylacyl-CoA dehydrogenase [Actinomadura rubrisoli]
MSTSSGTVTVIGAGTIGLGWTTLFLASGLTVRVNSRNPEAADVVRKAVELHAPGVPGGADPADLLSRLELESDLEKAVADADVVQENTPEDARLKQELFGRIEKAAPAGALLLSSTSSIPPAVLGTGLREPDRVVVGHPFNPPHVVPLVEVVGGRPELVERAAEFYRSVGKVPVVLRKPILGFAANRLQSALLRESIHLVREGVVTVGELDEIVTASIGLRWSTVGPFLAFHLGGGPGGLRHWLSHLGVGLEAGWEQLGRPAMDEETVRLLVEQADTAYGGRTFEELTVERDIRQNAVLEALAKAPAEATTAAAGAAGTGEETTR